MQPLNCQECMGAAQLAMHQRQASAAKRCTIVAPTDHTIIALCRVVVQQATWTLLRVQQKKCSPNSITSWAWRIGGTTSLLH